MELLVEVHRVGYEKLSSDQLGESSASIPCIWRKLRSKTEVGAGVRKVTGYLHMRTVLVLYSYQ